jgi:hypothetical protein
VDAWTFIWLMFLLKIPIVGLFLIVRWAVRQEPGTATAEEDGGIGFTPGPRHPHHPRPRPRPRGRSPVIARRGPHRGSPALPPPRIRTAAARARVTRPRVTRP